MEFHFDLFSMSFRCATQSECAPQVSGLMSTAGKREWSVVNERNKIRTAAKEKISPEELTINTRPMRGKYLINICCVKYLLKF